MNTPIKPRYRLGTQHMLDLAKDDARLIPENTLFKLSEEAWVDDREGRVVVRYEDDIWGADESNAAFVAVNGSHFTYGDSEYDKAYFSVGQLKPFL